MHWLPSWAAVWLMFSRQQYRKGPSRSLISPTIQTLEIPPSGWEKWRGLTGTGACPSIRRRLIIFRKQICCGRWLGRLLRGEIAISLGMSEPEAGSAATDLKTTATPDGDGFRINGTKVFASHSPDAELFLVYVRYGRGIDGIGSVLIERGTPGLTLGKPVRYVGGDDWCQLYFEDVRVPAENRS